MTPEGVRTSVYEYFDHALLAPAVRPPIALVHHTGERPSRYRHGWRPRWFRHRVNNHRLPNHCRDVRRLSR